MTNPTTATIGVIIVTYDAEDVIEECIESLLDTQGCELQIFVVENASTDDTAAKIRDKFKGHPKFVELNATEAVGCAPAKDSVITLIDSDVNRGYAGGVNIGLQHCQNSSEIDYFWIINPDCRVLPFTCRKFVERAEEAPKFGLMGGRVLYAQPDDTIQSDGGAINSWTGMCANLNLAKDARKTPFPSADSCDYISGACMFVSRRFLEKVGPMKEDYFLYYEEVDWAFRRQDFDLVLAPDAVVYHHAGTSIDSPVVGKTQGSAFSNYFNYRNRIYFMREFYPSRVPVTYLYSFLKVIRLVLQGHFTEAEGAFRGLNNMKPPKSVETRLSFDAYQLACGRKKIL